MIPDFKTYIGESVWGDMRKRSSGEIIRKEDDINNYDGQEMADYISNHYNVKLDCKITYREYASILTIPIIVWKENKLPKVDSLYYDYNKNTIFISILFNEDTFKKLMFHSPFSISKYGYGYYSITPKKGDVNNKFLLEVIDFIIDNTKEFPILVKEKMNESAWGDMRKRSSGEIIRKEDDINNLSFDEFVEYLKNTYTSTVDPKFFQIGAWYTPGNDKLGHISIPIEKNNSKDTPNLGNRMIDIVEDTQRDEFEIRLNKYFFRLYPNEMVKTFKDKYSCVKRSDNRYDIYPITGEITNQICVNVIDRLLSMVENPILKKNS